MDKDKINSIPFFFIIGRPRSGTTLLRTLFDAHPNVVIPLESQIIKLLYEKYGKKKLWDEPQLNELLADIKKDWKFEVWNIDESKLKQDLQACVGESDPDHIIKIIYLNYISHFKKKEILLFGDKNPEYSLYIDKLAKYYPEAKYIHITRDYRDQIVSYLKFDFQYPNISLLAYRWKRSIRKVIRVKRKIGSNFFTLRYEDLVENPAKYIESICSFLGIEYLPSLLEFHKDAKDFSGSEVQHKLKNKYHKNLFRPIDNCSVGLWKEKLSSEDVKVADLIIGKYAENFGYSRQSKKFYPLIYLKILPLLISRRVSRMLSVIIDRLPYDKRIEVKSKESFFIRQKTNN